MTEDLASELERQEWMKYNDRLAEDRDAADRIGIKVYIACAKKCLTRKRRDALIAKTMQAAVENPLVDIDELIAKIEA